MPSESDKPIAARLGASRTQRWTRIGGVITACALLAGVIVRENRQINNRWSSLLTGNPRTGAEVFEAKGCASCHSPSGVAEGRAPDLGSDIMSRSRPDQLVTAMWNHAPQMWKQMHEARIHYPTFTEREMAHLLSYLYTVRYVGEPGDPSKGRVLFQAKGCSSCHVVSGEEGSPAMNRTVLSPGVTVVGWATAMWNHPAPGEGQDRPAFHDREMIDIFSYVRGGRLAQKIDGRLLNADFAGGWKVFRDKSCLACHSIKDEAGRIGPELGPAHELPPTVLQLAGSIWNHSPTMFEAMEHLRIERPRFQENEMADLVAFLYSFRYAEPGGSAGLGQVLFVSRGCSQCHGAEAQGIGKAPGLRGHEKHFTSVSMAADLWNHGPTMFRHAEELGLPWPHLAENDIGSLIAYLNTSPANRSELTSN